MSSTDQPPRVSERSRGLQLVELRRLRRERGWSQEELAFHAGVNVETIRRPEKGRGVLGDTAQSIAAALGVTVDKLLGSTALAASSTHVPQISIQPTLHSLPPLPAGFVGRESDLVALRKVNPASGALITSLRGMGGIGKTALALVLAHEWTPRFPDAQLFLDARGTQADPPSARRLMEQVVQTFHPTVKLPDDDATVRAFYQSELKDKKVLLLVDNARDAAQAAPLIPPQCCALIVTSRQNFLLGTKRAHTVGKLPDDQATALLREYHPALTDAEAVELTRLCAGLPLALKLAGVHLALDAAERDGRPDVAGFIRQLGSGRLARLDADAPDANEVTVSESFRLSEAQLPADWREPWRKLGIFTVGFDAGAAQAVAGAHDTMLGHFVRRSLLEPEGDDRYKLHDLAADYARGRLDTNNLMESELAHATHFAKLLREAEEAWENGNLIGALALFDRERGNIEAAQAFTAKSASQSEAAARLTVVFGTTAKYVVRLRLHLRKQLEWLSASLLAAEKLGDRTGEAASVGEMGVAHKELGESRQGIPFLEKQLSICREIGNRRGEAMALGNLGNTYSRLGDERRAIEFYEQELGIAREIGHRTGEGISLGNMAVAYYGLGDARKAVDFFEQSLAIVRETSNRHVESSFLGTLGVAWFKLGELDKSISLQEEALKALRDLGDRSAEGVRLTGLAHAYSAKGDVEKATSCYVQAAEIAAEVGDTLNQAHALYNLANMHRNSADNAKATESMEQARALYAACESPIAAQAEEHLARWAGDTGTLVDSYERRLALARRSRDRDLECSLLIDLGDSYQQLSDLPRSLEYTESALVIARDTGNREYEGICFHNLGEFRFVLGELQASREHYAQSLVIASEMGFKLLEANAQWGLAQIEHRVGNGSAAIALAESALAIHEVIEAKVEAEKVRTGLAQWQP